MRTWVTAAVTIAVLTMPNYAHSQSFSRSHPTATPTPPSDEVEPVVDEKKYKAAVDRIGGQRQGKYDPWQNMREKPPAK